MNPSASPISTFRSKKILKSNPKSDESQASDLNTPQKSIQIPRRPRNGSVALSVKEVRKYAQGLHKSKKKETPEEPDLIESSTLLSKPKKKAPIKLPEKYELLFEFFKSMLISIRLLQLKKKMTSFTNISPKIESLTDRRFSYAHLAQLKYILPEVIILKKVLLQDEHTLCMKPDLQISLEIDSIVMEKGKSGYSSLEKEFRSRLSNFSKTHPQEDDVPQETLPSPFNERKQVLPTINEASTRAVPMGSSSSSASSSLLGSLPRQNPVTTSHLAGSFQRRFSQKVLVPEIEKTSLLPRVPIKTSNSAAQSTTFNSSFLKKGSPCSVLQIRSPLGSSSKPPLSPLVTSAKIKSKTDEDYNEKDVCLIEGTPAKLISTPAKLMTSTPDLQTPKRCRLNQDDDSIDSPNKLLRRPLKKSLFNTPVKNAKAMEMIIEERSSLDSDSIKLLPEELIQSIRENERKIMEEQDPDITRAKLRKRTIACLPKMFDVIYLTFQSMNRSVTTKEDLVRKIMTSHLDVIDRREVIEQLTLLQELVPDWISEKVSYSGDLLLRINKTVSIDSLRRRLAEAV